MWFGLVTITCIAGHYIIDVPLLTKKIKFWYRDVSYASTVQ